MEKDILKISRSKWRTGGGGRNKTGRGQTMLLNNEGYMCCLGFRCNQLGIPKKDLLDKMQPSYLRGWEIPDLITTRQDDSAFCGKAMEINDSPELTAREREKQLIAHFAKKGTTVIFTGRYPK